MPTPTAWTPDLLRDPHHTPDKRARVQKMFAAIAPSYDLNNRLHSLWLDQRWRKKAVRLASLNRDTDRIIDVACGTGDLTFRFADDVYGQAIRGKRFGAFGEAGVIGIDFTREMLTVAKAKDAARWERWRRRHAKKKTTNVDYPTNTFGLKWINADALSLPLPDASCDVLSIAFGIRNITDPLAALKEFRRVLRPNGRLIILEFSLPTNPILKTLYNFYFRQILPRTATLISRDKTGAYKYLPESVNTFISPSQMQDMMTSAGFSQITQHPLTFGICICYRGFVPF